MNKLRERYKITGKFESDLTNEGRRRKCRDDVGTIGEAPEISIDGEDAQ